MYSCTVALISDECGWSIPLPRDFTPGNDQVPIVWETVWAPDLARMGKKILPHRCLTPGVPSP